MTNIKAGTHILNDANLGNAPGWLNCQMESTKEILERDLALAVQTSAKAFEQRVSTINTLRNSSSDLDPEFERLAVLERSTLEFFKPSTQEADSLKDDSLAQLSFTHEEFRCLNHVPFVLLAIAIFKIWVVPAINVLFPLIAWIMPYILLRFVYALPITQDQYMGIIRTMWSGEIMNPEAIFGGGVPMQSLLTPKSIAQGVFFAVSFGQSMIQPIQNAMHLYKTDGVFLKMGRDILEIRNAIRRLKALDVPLSPALEDLDDDPRRAFVLIREQPERLRVALRSLARLEILWRMSQETRLQPVVFQDGPLALRDVIDISLPDGVPSSIELSGTTTHAVITGPNGGGKSSFMRAVLQAVLFGHSYGYAPGGAQMPRFKWIASGLQLRDSPGRLSMFETEVKFAATALAAGHGPGLVLFDELFHSTNAPDGERTATLFLKALWSRANVFSIVSTHLFKLIEEAPETVKAVCCQASESPDGGITYSYRVEPGICRVSSVKTVWERFGLAAATPRVAKS